MLCNLQNREWVMGKKGAGGAGGAGEAGEAGEAEEEIFLLSFPLPFTLSRQMLHLGKPLGASLSLWQKTALPPLSPCVMPNRHLHKLIMRYLKPL
jgi:hypothetical protein